MDPITFTILALAAVAFLVGLIWTWEIFGGLLQLVVVIAVLYVAFGLLTDPDATKLQVINCIKSLVDFAHQIRDAVTH